MASDPTTSQQTGASPASPASPTATANQTYANVGAVVVVDDSNEESSVFGDGESDRTSLSSSILNYQYENGRRYHGSADGKYMMPNDDNEQDRLDLTHHIFLLLLGGKLNLAPIQSPQKVLDLGTGTGIWAIDFADTYPEAHVIGCDLSPIQPGWVPPNVEFIVDDFEKDWMYPPNHFDVIHARTIAGCVADWPRLLKQAFTHTKPGGYIELQENAIWAWDEKGALTNETPYMQYLTLLDEAGHKIGREMNIYDKIKQWAIDAGFVDVVEKAFYVPMAPWPKDPALKEVGKYYGVMAQDAVEAYGLRLYTQVLGWDPAQAQIHHALVRRQLKDPKLQLYTKIYMVHGRKPPS